MILIGCLVSYLIGSIPVGYIFGKAWKGIDIRQHGSGNLGATNVLRVLGPGPGAVVLALDILKGLVAITLVGDALGLIARIDRILLAVAAVAGHNWTVFLRFKGGKGIATSLGVLIGLTIKIASIRPVLLITVLVWIGFFLVTRIVSLASLAAAAALPLCMLLIPQPLEILALGIVFCVFVWGRHKANIQRLLQGQEPRLQFKRKSIS